MSLVELLSGLSATTIPFSSSTIPPSLAALLRSLRSQAAFCERHVEAKTALRDG